MKSRVAGVLLFLAPPAAALACIWDYDTLKQERARFPSAHELMTGKFLRHSPEFFEWRIKDRTEKLKSEPSNPNYLDDLAVAYHKTGHNDKAIATMEEKERISPGLYETYSNWGTFYVLAGDFDQGLPLLDKALAINPDAHFGRETYQRRLVKYASFGMKDGKLRFPLDQKETANGDEPGFSGYLRADPPKVTWHSDGLKAVLGMMRFANHDNPLLLEALGDLLDGHLGARSYLLASYKFKGEPAEGLYRSKAESALNRAKGNQYSIHDLERDLRGELAEADEWYSELRSKEIDWINRGLNADAEFDRLYELEPEVVGPAKLVMDSRRRDFAAILWTAVGILGLIGLGAFVVFQRRYYRQTPQS